MTCDWLERIIGRPIDKHSKSGIVSGLLLLWWWWGESATDTNIQTHTSHGVKSARTWAGWWWQSQQFSCQVRATFSKSIYVESELPRLWLHCTCSLFSSLIGERNRLGGRKKDIGIEVWQKLGTNFKRFSHCLYLSSLLGSPEKVGSSSFYLNIPLM